MLSVVEWSPPPHTSDWAGGWSGAELLQLWNRFGRKLCNWQWRRDTSTIYTLSWLYNLHRRIDLCYVWFWCALYNVDRIAIKEAQFLLTLDWHLFPDRWSDSTQSGCVMHGGTELMLYNVVLPIVHCMLYCMLYIVLAASHRAHDCDMIIAWHRVGPILQDSINIKHCYMLCVKCY